MGKYKYVPLTNQHGYTFDDIPNRIASIEGEIIEVVDIGHYYGLIVDTSKVLDNQ